MHTLHVHRYVRTARFLHALAIHHTGAWYRALSFASFLTCRMSGESRLPVQGPLPRSWRSAWRRQRRARGAMTSHGDLEGAGCGGRPWCKRIARECPWPGEDAFVRGGAAWYCGLL